MIGLLIRRPRGLGVTEGRLAASRKSPNCVNSQADPNDVVHFIEPFRFDGDPADAWRRLTKIVGAQPRVEITEQRDFYLHAECTTRLLRFVDDLEFFLEPGERRIQVRSASRIGRTDFGANRRRVEALRTEFERRR